MATAGTKKETKFRDILFLTDFSGSSQAALSFAIMVGREYGATVHALHILLPTPYPYAYSAPHFTAAALEAEEENAQAEMQKVESQMAGLEHETNVSRGINVWPGVEQAIRDCAIDLIVVGTHGRTGADKLLLGSVAEEIFRRSPVPVLTIGPRVRSDAHKGGRFRRMLFATDLTPGSLAGAPYALSLAQKNQAQLLLLLVMPKPEHPSAADNERLEVCAAEARQRLSRSSRTMRSWNSPRKQSWNMASRRSGSWKSANREKSIWSCSEFARPSILARQPIWKAPSRIGWWRMHPAQCLRCEVRRSVDASLSMADGRLCGERATGRLLR